MNIIRRYRSPNYGPQLDACEFVVIHYTACRLRRALAELLDPERKISSHILISKEGRLYELVECFSGSPRKAYHAGNSRWLSGNTCWEGFNDFSIGIELENQNGNLLPYTSGQYDALQLAMKHLKELYPSLRSPDRVLGHEHVADWRGKIDPGYMFDWKRFYSRCYPGEQRPERKSSCPEALREALRLLLPFTPRSNRQSDDFWHVLSLIGERSLALSASSHLNRHK